jgi:hypothetical protein
MARTSKTLKAITTEAKAIRKSKPSLTWQQAIKQASKFYRDTVKPTAKKVAVKTKKVAKAAKKGYDTALLEYKKNTIGKASAKKVIKTKSSVKTGSGKKIGVAVKKPVIRKTKSVSILKKGVKPLKPTFTILNKQNDNFFKDTKSKKKLIVYSPLYNRYIVILQYSGLYQVYVIGDNMIRQGIAISFKVVGTPKDTLNRINKQFGIDLIP